MFFSNFYEYLLEFLWYGFMVLYNGFSEIILFIDVFGDWLNGNFLFIFFVNFFNVNLYER